MTRNDYLTSLGNLIKGIPEADRREILYDYEEHFTNGLAEGKTEDEIAKSLGDVRVVARQFKAYYSVRQAETDSSVGNILRAVLATVGLGFFNLLFVLGPFLALVGVLLNLYAVAVVLTVGGTGALLAPFLAHLFPAAINIGGSYAFVAFLGIGIACLGVLFFIGTVYLTRFVFKGTLHYLKWNLEIIKK